MCSSVFKHGLMRPYIHSSCIIDEGGIFPNARGEKPAAGTGTQERGNRGRRVEGVRFLRSWGNFVPVLIDFGPFEILLAIKLTVRCAISTVVRTCLKFLLLFKQTAHASAPKQFKHQSLSFPELMPATTQGEQVSSSNWDYIYKNLT